MLLGQSTASTSMINMVAQIQEEIIESNEENSPSLLFNVSMLAKCPNADFSANVRFNDKLVQLPSPFSWDEMLAKTVELGLF